MPASTQTWVAWAATLLIVAGLITMILGAVSLAQSRNQGYFRVRRQAILRGWRNLLYGALLIIASGVVSALAPRALEVILPPTSAATSAALATTPPPAATPPATAAQRVGLVTATAAPSDISRPTVTGTLPTPTLTLTPTITPTPALPLGDIVLPAGTLTVTPPEGAVIGNLRVSRFNDCASQRSVSDTFTTPAKPLYALFDYDGWLPGARWSSVWRSAGQVVYTDTRLWDGSTGGCGFADYDNGGQPWAEGAYEVQIFSGERWLGSAQFTISDRTPTPAP